MLLIGHVTKEGLIAGPRILEHMVDTVLYFESDPGSRFRVVRAVKNRFGAANEIGVFAMAEQGLREVRNPSAIFLSRHAQPVPGSVVTVAREGSRPLLVEVQALVDEAQGMSPRRVAVGFESSRLALLLAVLHRHGGVVDRRAATCSSTSSAACASARRRPTCRRCSRCSRACATARCAHGHGLLRRARAHRRDPSGAVRRGAAARGGEAGLPARARAGGATCRAGVIDGLEVEGVRRLEQALAARSDAAEPRPSVTARALRARGCRGAIGFSRTVFTALSPVCRMSIE